MEAQENNGFPFGKFLIGLQTKWKWEHFAFNLRDHIQVQGSFVYAIHNRRGEVTRLMQNWGFISSTVYILNVTWKIDIILGKLNRHFEIHVGLALQFDYSLFYIFSVLHFQFFLFLKILPRTLHLQNLTIIGLRVLLSCFLFPNRWDRNIQCHHWFFPLRHEHKERSS